MRVLLNDLVLFSCLLAFVTGIVIAVASHQLKWSVTTPAGQCALWQVPAVVGPQPWRLGCFPRKDRTPALRFPR
jgi:hypothetical protein